MAGNSFIQRFYPNLSQCVKNSAPGGVDRRKDWLYYEKAEQIFPAPGEYIYDFVWRIVGEFNDGKWGRVWGVFNEVVIETYGAGFSPELIVARYRDAIGDRIRVPERVRNMQKEMFCQKEKGRGLRRFKIEKWLKDVEPFRKFEYIAGETIFKNESGLTFTVTKPSGEVDVIFFFAGVTYFFKRQCFFEGVIDV